MFKFGQWTFRTLDMSIIGSKAWEWMNIHYRETILIMFKCKSRTHFHGSSNSNVHTKETRIMTVTVRWQWEWKWFDEDIFHFNCCMKWCTWEWKSTLEKEKLNSSQLVGITSSIGNLCPFNCLKRKQKRVESPLWMMISLHFLPILVLLIFVQSQGRHNSHQWRFKWISLSRIDVISFSQHKWCHRSFD